MGRRFDAEPPIAGAGVADDDRLLLKTAAGSRNLTVADFAALATLGPMSRFHTAMLNDPIVSAMLFADSLGEGYNPPTSANFLNDRWWTRLGALLRTRYGLSPGGLGYVNSVNNCSNGTSGAGDAWWTDVGSVSSTSTDVRAFGHQTALPAANTVPTLHVANATSFRAHYSRGAATNIGDIAVNVDSGAHTWTIAPSPTTGAVDYQGLDTQCPVMSSGSHAASFTPASGKIAHVHGAFHHNGDEAAGLWLWDNSQSGITATLESTYDPIDQIALCADTLALVVILLGTNDFGAHTSTASFISAMEALIASINAKCPTAPSVCVVAPHERGDAGGSPSPSWASYVTAYNQIFADDIATQLTLIDMSSKMVKPTDANSHSSGKCNADNVHLSSGPSGGNAFYASAIDTDMAAA